MLVSVCVPVYQRHPEPNVASLAASLDAALDGVPGELVVTLNGIAAADAGVPDGVRTVALEHNMGVAPGWNAAAAAARGDVLVFGNDDMRPGRGSLRVLATALAEHPDVGVGGPVGTRWDLEQGRHVDWVPTDGLDPGALVDCDVVSGFCFAARREVWEQAGRFDEAYAPASWEEVDFCTTVRRRLGLRCCAVAGVDVAHEWGISRRQPPWRRIRWGGRSELLWSIHRRNRRRFLAKWA